MAKQDLKLFTQEVIDNIQYYVYRLIDPRNGETFYIGKGKGNRVFAHASGDIEKDSLSEKMSRVREILISGFDVAHVIHRHGMNERTAFEVEAALIDAYPSTTNITDGHGNSEYGVMHSNEIIKKYAAAEAEFTHKALLINVNRSALEASLYEATRYSWRLSKSKAQKADIVLAVVKGVIVGAFVAEEWLTATSSNFPGREPIEGRYGFHGTQAPEDIVSLYVGKRLPARFTKKGASNPIKYTW